VKKTCWSWLREGPTAVVILGSLIVPACSSGTSGTSTAANNHNLNKTETYAASEQCDPNYSGCVPVASDVDCVGGSGNGPAYVKGPVKVIGKDIYRLDRDGDGIACE
jgi:hypothetical protein